MPFAIIAVTILLLASVAGVAIADHHKVDSGIDQTRDSAKAIESAMDNVQSYMNRELGILILGISKDESLGGLDERASVFEKRAYAWIDDRFPMKSGSVRLDLRDREIRLTSESMEIAAYDGVPGGMIPTYLHGEGIVKVTGSSEYGRTSKELIVSTDGSYSLPLVAEQGSLFVRMSEGNGISVSQIMAYELQSLAQLRVINGYGSKSQYGSKGTDSIITRQDVETAYSNALDLVGTICFRDPDGAYLNDRIDLADVMAGDKVYLDVSAFYGQVMMSIVDDLVLKWYDYLSGDKLTRHFNDKLMISKIAVDALIRFVSGDDPFSAAGYITKIMDDNGIEPQSYRTPGHGTTAVTVNGITVTVQNPTVDILDQSWIKLFNIHYSASNNYILDDIRFILNSASENLFKDSAHVLLELDPSDNTSFLDSLSNALATSPYSLEHAISSSLSMVINEGSKIDPFYAAIADSVMRHAESLIDTEGLRYAISEAVISENPALEDDIEEIAYSQPVEDAIHRYRSKFYQDLSVYERLREVEGGSSNPLLELMSDAALFMIRDTGLTALVSDRAGTVIEEFVSNMVMNPYSGPFGLPDSDCFVLVDDSGNRTREKLRFEYSNDSVIKEPKILKKRCSHMTGPLEMVAASYTTTFLVELEDIIDYRIEGNGSFSSALGQPFTSAMTGTVRNDISVEVSVASAWALAGVQYNASETFLSDVWGVLAEYFKPIIEPLREIMAIVMDVVDILNTCIVEITHYVTDALSSMMERILGPMKILEEWIEWGIIEIMDMYEVESFFSLNLNEQVLGFEYMGYTFEIKLNLASLYSSTKTLLIASIAGPLAGMDVEASMSVKCRGDINGENIFITGKAAIQSDDWKVKLSLDPLMKAGKHLVTVSADIDDVSITAVLPELEDYNELGLTLSRIPGVGEMLNNIPLPGLGVNVGLDAGISIKYKVPTSNGLVINEFEPNPAGNDSGKEWVELLNNTNETIDLEGYTLIASSDRSKKKMVLSGSISPGEFLVIYPTFSMVNNSGKLTKNGEGLTLKDPDGAVVDKTGTHKDNSDDGMTWQRSYDGSSQWEFKEGTEGRSNGSYISSNLLTAEIAKEIIIGSVQDAFDKVDSITDSESLQTVMQEIVKSAVNRVIKKIAGCLVEASVFIKVDVKDMTSTASTGIRLALRCDSDLVEDVLKYIAGQVESMALSIKSPYRIDPVSMFSDNIDLEVTIDSKIQYPAILAHSIEEDLPQVDLGVTFRINMSALTKILGKDTGKPGIECGIRVIDCPMLIIPGKLSPKSGMEHDMWLIKMNIDWT